MMLKEVLKQFLVKNKLLFLPILLIILLLISRFVWLDRFPGGLDADSVEVVMSAKTINLFGVDSSGTDWKKMLFGNSTNAKIAGLPSILLSPLNYFAEVNLKNVRIPFVIINIATILFLALLVYEFTKEKFGIFFTLLVGLTNPWLFAYSRMPTEATFALFFVVFGIYLFFKLRGWNILYSLIPFLIAFYSYFGAKPLLLLIVPALVFYHYKINKKKPIKIYLSYIVLFGLFVSLYFYLSSQSGFSTFSTRSKQEILFSNTDSFSVKVDEYRRASIDFPYKTVFINKYTVMSAEFVGKYLSWISSDLLFFKGDTRGMYTFEDHGLFYIVDILFIIVGIYGLHIYKKVNFLLLMLLLIAPLPSALSINGESFFYRGFLLIPGVLILISIGISYLYKTINEKYQLYFSLFVSLVYLLLFARFIIFYFFRYPVKQQDNFFLNGRIVANYIKRTDPSEKIMVVTTSPFSIFNEFLFYTKVGRENKNLFTNQVDEYVINNLTITKHCPLVKPKSVLILDGRLDCDDFRSNYLVIQNQSDSGTSFKIIADKLCQSKELTNYRRNHLISDYNIEALDTDMFCNRWIQKGNEK